MKTSAKYTPRLKMKTLWVHAYGRCECDGETHWVSLYAGEKRPEHTHRHRCDCKAEGREAA